MIFITGDNHSKYTRFSTKSFIDQKELTKDDYVIICGDFGCIWKNEPDKEEMYWLKWFESKPYTTLFIDGNHENHDRLDKYPVEEWKGGKIHRISPSVIHLMRGQVYNIDGITFFTFGGASSNDIDNYLLDSEDINFKNIRKRFDREYILYRVKGESWWERELPNQQELDEGLKNLKAAGNKVDFILTHTPWTSMIKSIETKKKYKTDYFTDYLEQIKETVDYKKWFFGHMHIDQDFGKEVAVYKEIIRIK